MRFLLFFIFCALLTGCSLFSSSDKNPPLVGERLDVLTYSGGAPKIDADLAKQPFTLPVMAKVSDWPQMAQTARHISINSTLEKIITEAWSVSIGRGETGRRLLTAEPVIAQGRIFTMDTDAAVSAFDAKTGHKIWQVSTAPARRFSQALDGGIAFGAGKIYVTNGTRELWALDAKNGGKIWKVIMPALARAAPTVFENNLYIVTRANQLLAINAANGETRWQHNGLPEVMGVVGSPSPAADADLVITAYSSGEIYALRPDTGSIVWAEGVTARDAKGGLASLNDLRAPPVLFPDMVIAANYANSAVGIDRRLGERIWSQDFGSINALQVTDNALFALTLNSEMMALDRKSGGIRWKIKLPVYENPDDKDNAIEWHGPLLADNNILLINSRGELWRLDPANGATLSKQSNYPISALTPVIAGGTLYIISKDGQLSAYR